MAHPHVISPSWSDQSSRLTQFTPSLESDGDDSTSGHMPRGRDGTAVDLSRLGSGISASQPLRNQVTESQIEDEGDPSADAFLLEDYTNVSHGPSSFSPVEEQRVRRKLDTHLVLFVALLYLISFLDRSNIGNARLAGLTTDLDLSDSQFEWLLTAFYITYIVFEPLTLFYAAIPAHIHLAVTVAAWGILATLQCLANSFAALLTLRALLGIAEAAFVGVPVYMSFFFRREELALRTGLFISAAPLASTFASTLAYLIIGWTKTSPVAAWRWLFLVEGFPACVVAIWAFDWLPDSPATARWLSPQEQKIAVARLRVEIKDMPARLDGSYAKEDDTDVETSGSDVPGLTTIQRRRAAHQSFSWRHVLATLRDPKPYLGALIFLLCNIAFSSMPVFLPTIVAGLNEKGISPQSAQAYSAPPFLFAFLVVLSTALLSDRFQSRSLPLMFHGCMAAAGYSVLALAAFSPAISPTTRYLAVFPICAGFFSAVTLLITWTINNQREKEGKGAGVAILNIVGQMGPLIGTRLYPDSEGPFYTRGMSVCAVAMAGVVILTWVLRRVLMKENESRQSPGFIYLL